MTDRKRSTRPAQETRSGRSSGRLGLREIARLAGVSHITVSRVLHAPHKVAAPTRERVEALLREVDYIPNLVAGSLASNRSRIIGAVVPSLRNSIAADYVDGMSEVLEQHGLHLMVGCSRQALDTEEQLVRTFLGRRAEGLFLYGGSHSEPVRSLIRTNGPPTVEVGMLPADPIDMAVGHSDFDAARDMTRFLVETGRRRIGFIGLPTADNLREAERQRGYLAAIEEAGLAMAPTTCMETPFEPGTGGRALVALLDRHPELDAVFLSVDFLAVDALAACHDRGVNVPGQLAIAGFGDLELARVVWPRLTTVRTPRQAIGARAGQMLIDQLAGRPVEPKVVEMSYEIVRRGSA